MEPDTDLIQEAERLITKTEDLSKQGRYKEAIPLAQQALTITERALGPDNQDTAQCFNNLAFLYCAMGTYPQAEPLMQRALAIAEKVLGPDHPHTATALNNLAELYRITGDYAKAEPLYQRSLAIREKVLGPEHPDTALALNNLAGLYDATGAYTKAKSLLERVLAITEKVLGPEHPDTARSLNNLGWLYCAMGSYVHAEPLYERARAIREKVLGPGHPDTAVSFNNLALLYITMGIYAKAEPLYQRALAIREKVLGPEHPDTAVGLNGLAALYHDTGTYTKAEPLYERVRAIREKVLGPEHPDTANSLNSLAVLYADTGAYAKAESLYQRALAIREKALGPDHPDTATSLNNLAGRYYATEAYAHAKPLAHRALAIREKTLGPMHPDTAQSLNNLARLYWVTDDLPRARSFKSQAHAIQEKNLSTFFLTGSESRKQAYLAQMRESVSETISLSLIMMDRQVRELGFQSVLTVKGRVLDAMSDSTVRLRASVKPEDRAIVEELTTVVQQWSMLTYRGVGNLHPETYHQQLQELVARQEQLETDLSTRSAEFRQEIPPITLTAVQAAIPKDAALVEWYCYEPFDPKAKIMDAKFRQPRYVVYLLRHDGEPVTIDLGLVQPIDDLIPEFCTALSDRASTHFKEVATVLFEKLITPLRPHFGQSNQLLLCPDGALNLVPFAALVDERGDFLLQHFELTYLTSGRDLLRMTDESKPRESAVVLADPDYGTPPSESLPVETVLEPTRSADLDRSGTIFPELKGTAQEAAALQSLLDLDAEHVLTRDRATEANLRKLSGPRILHLATHGFFLNDLQLKATLRHTGFSDDMGPVPLSENPLLRSGLALAGANARRSGETDDGILTAAEVSHLDLRGTQLVVLSACETGLGTVQDGEGVYGLRRALVLAGAQAQLVSLWKVNDEATRELMVDYYKRLLAGEGRSAALRSVQQTMLENPARQHPCYWAAFIPIGDWTPLPPIELSITRKQ